MNYKPVTLTATADPGSAFEGFDICPGTSCTIDPIDPGITYQVNATFVRVRPAQFPLAVTVSGSGKVTSQPGGIDCGSHLHGAIRHRQHGDAHRDTDSGLVVRGLVGRLHRHGLLPGKYGRPARGHGDVRAAGHGLRRRGGGGRRHGDE